MMIKFTNSGLGAPPADLSNITEPISQERSFGNDKHRGTGLELSIVKSLVDLHGGKFDINNRGGEGTMLTVTLPNNKS